MMVFSKWFRPLAVLVLTLLLIVGWQTVTPAQSNTAFLSSRVSRLESENSSLRSRISRLEGDITRISSSIGLNYTYSTPSEPGSPTPATPAADPMFDRLATLAIELRDRIITLENQVADLQQRVP
ncbi:hypothetical protein [Egbenema bharatensis]|uniref:hypothetical protein n=1 Tax=Egbenema bharatensis TaxID=3463334 RepID=UPI003A871F09